MSSQEPISGATPAQQPWAPYVLPADYEATFEYSPALAAARFTWTAEQLDLWLQSPQRLVPGTKMFFSLADASARQDVIAYLQTLGPERKVATGPAQYDSTTAAAPPAARRQ